jgi:hypothetical protein
VGVLLILGSCFAICPNVHAAIGKTHTDKQLWYVPTAMSSANEAIAILKSMRGAFYPCSGLIHVYEVDSYSLRMAVTFEEVKKKTEWVYTGWGWAGGYYQDQYIPSKQEGTFNLNFASIIEIRIFDYGIRHGVQMNSTGTSDTLYVDSYNDKNFEVSKRLTDAIFTLAMAQNAKLKPLTGIIMHSQEYTSKYLLKPANLTKGAAIFSPPMGGNLPANMELASEDIITEISYNGKVIPITDDASWSAAVTEVVKDKADNLVTAKVYRNGVASLKEIPIVDYARGVKVQLDNSAPGQQPPKRSFGIELKPLDEATIKLMGIQSTEGFLVQGVEQNSPAAKMGLKENDILAEVNGIPVRSIAQARDLIVNYGVASVKVRRENELLLLQAAIKL